MPTDDALRAHVVAAFDAAATFAGVVSRVSAAVTWGWDVRQLPTKPQITIPRHRRLSSVDLDRVSVRRMDLPEADLAGLVTDRGRTLVDCARHLSFPEALPIANAALRMGFPPEQLAWLAATAKGPGSIKVRMVARHADARPVNAFESTLLAICRSVPGLDVVPQHDIAGVEFLGRADLVDPELRIVVEADSFTWHGGRDALVRDARRYNGFTVNGWLVLRFTWDDVMFHPAFVRDVLVAAVSCQLDANRVFCDRRRAWGA